MELFIQIFVLCLVIITGISMEVFYCNLNCVMASNFCVNMSVFQRQYSSCIEVSVLLEVLTVASIRARDPTEKITVLKNLHTHKVMKCICQLF
jgi:hypothetical protein